MLELLGISSLHLVEAGYPLFLPYCQCIPGQVAHEHLKQCLFLPPVSVYLCAEGDGDPNPHSVLLPSLCRKWLIPRCFRSGCAWPAAVMHTLSLYGDIWSPSGPCLPGCWTMWSTSLTAMVTLPCTTPCHMPTSLWFGSCWTAVSLQGGPAWWSDGGGIGSQAHERVVAFLF